MRKYRAVKGRCGKARRQQAMLTIGIESPWGSYIGLGTIGQDKTGRA